MKYYILYRVIGDKFGAKYQIECERLEEAQLVWDTLMYLRNAYNVVSARPE